MLSRTDTVRRWGTLCYMHTLSKGMTPVAAAKATSPDPAGNEIPIGKRVCESPPVPTCFVHCIHVALMSLPISAGLAPEILNKCRHARSAPFALCTSTKQPEGAFNIDVTDPLRSQPDQTF